MVGKNRYEVRFGRELEALLGSSARYATANTEAFSQLAWSADDVEILEEQWKSTVGFREVAVVIIPDVISLMRFEK